MKGSHTTDPPRKAKIPRETETYYRSPTKQELTQACVTTHQRLQVRQTRMQTHSSRGPRCWKTRSQAARGRGWSDPAAKGRVSGSGLRGGGRTTCRSNCGGRGGGGRTQRPAEQWSPTARAYSPPPPTVLLLARAATGWPPPIAGLPRSFVLAKRSAR